MAVPAWFNYDVYMQNKLASLQATDPSYTLPQVVEAFASAGYAGEEGALRHFEEHGADEEIAPNAYFNAEQYYIAKTLDYYGLSVSAVDTGSVTWLSQLQYVKSALEAAGFNAWTHYVAHGSAEDVNPSNAFSQMKYCQAKADAMNAAGMTQGNGGVWTADAIFAAITGANMTVLEHYLQYAGTGIGEAAAGTDVSVPAGDRVAVEGTTILVENPIERTYTGTNGDDVFEFDEFLTGKDSDGNDVAPRVVYDGMSGSDTVVFNGEGSAAIGLQGTFSNIENVVFRGLDLDTLGGIEPIDVSSFTETVTMTGSVGRAEFSGVSGQTLIANGVSGNVFGRFTLDAEMVGSEANLVLANAVTDVDYVFELGGNNLKTVNLATDAARVTFSPNRSAEALNVIATSTDATKVADVEVSDLSAIKAIAVSGTGAVDFGQLAASVASVDATGNSGGVDAVFGRTSSAVTFDGGSGNDTVDLSAITIVSGTAVRGGAGIDTLKVTADQVASLKNMPHTGFEILALSNRGGTQTFSAADATGFEEFALSFEDTVSNDGFIVTGLASGATVSTDNGDEEGTVALSLANATGTGDSLGIVLKNTGDEAGRTSFSIDDVEVLNVRIDAAYTGTEGNDTLAFLPSATGRGATTINVTGGSTAVVRLSSTSDELATVNAGAYAGGIQIDVSASTLARVNVIGGQGNDTITLGNSSTATGGAGNDTFTVTATGLVSCSTITDFAAGDSLVFENVYLSLADNATVASREFTGFNAGTTSSALRDVAEAACRGNTANGDFRWFQLTENGQTDVYVVVDNSYSDGTFTEGTDLLVRLQGVTAADMAHASIDIHGALSL